MSTTILTVLGLLVSVVGITARIYFWRSGRNKERLKNAEGTLEDVQKANAARTDDDHDDELRDRYNV